jgi:hypothetical protein
MRGLFYFVFLRKSGEFDGFKEFPFFRVPNLKSGYCYIPFSAPLADYII